MKRFSFPIICGISFALVFVGYVVFAVYTGPTQAPPQGNVPAPLNVGPETQTKQGGLIISGGVDSPKVGAQQLCLGPLGGEICKGTWPKELLNTDVVAGGASYRAGPWRTACNQPSDGGSRCDAYWFFYYAPWFDLNIPKYDPRGVLTTSYSQVEMPCYEIPNGSSNSCGPKRRYPVISGFSCSGGFTADEGHFMANAVKEFCESGGANLDCRAAICRLP